MWVWVLAGAIVLPALLEGTASNAQGPIRALACGIVGAAIMLAGGLSARQRKGSWRLATLVWGLAFAAALTTYVVWGGYSEPLAEPGHLNAVTLDRDRVESLRRIRVSPETKHDLWRFVTSVWVLAAIAGTFEGWRQSAVTRSLTFGIMLAVTWVACLLPMTVLAIASVYAGDYLDNRLLPPGAGDVALRASVIAGGAACGLFLGSVTERLLAWRQA